MLYKEFINYKGYYENRFKKSRFEEANDRANDFN